MSFLHELSQTTAQARRDEAERKRLYDLETERLAQALAARAKEEFMEACQRAARNQKNQCAMHVYPSEEVEKRAGAKDITEQKLRAMLVELGFQDGKVQWIGFVSDDELLVSATWPEAGDASPKEPPQKRARGTSITCPICLEHRPAVVLIPCGHVVCRNCQHHQQFRQCPMCRGPVSSASNALFMD